ncbi:hypothetical protein DLAC_09225 [Tieghemostelium lacteum]|uniref:UBR-type domain-containing protein n=1 Tax=Tieghemostelium lacteum TaxID=361077 RepID=A0A151Z9H1_TIELA|nr:hypothetical protein DLAC_09225 [Tieghemostelium lacteum]|eukprot:KYQ90597.1 hypothetical protein DLAC_09225 [Tieghemostelium lacteum]
MEVQDWYECVTCNSGRSTGLCVSCAVVCHAGHKLSAVKNSKFYCDCGVGNFKVKNGLCKCLTPVAKVGGDSSSTSTATATTTATTTATATATATATTAPVTAQPSDAEVTKLIGSIKTNVLNPLKSRIERKDIVLIGKYRKELSEKLKEFQDKYATFTLTMPVIAQFIQEATSAILEADSSVLAIAASKELEIDSKDVLTYCKQTESAIKSKNVTSVQHNYGFLQKKLPAFLEKHANNPLAAEIIATVNSVQVKYESEFAAILADKEIDEQAAIFKPMVQYLESAIKRQNVVSALRWIDELKNKFPAFQSKYSIYPKSHSLIDMVNNVFLQVEATLSTIIIEKEISDKIRSLQPIVKALEGALSRKDSKSAMTWLNRLQVQLDIFREKYETYPQSQSFIQMATELLIKAQAENYEVIQEERANKFLNEIKPKVHALKGAFERKDVDSICTWRGQVFNRVSAAEFEFASNPMAKGVIGDIKELLNKVDSEMGQVLVDKKFSESIKIMTPMMQALTGALDRKDIDIVIKYRNQLNSQLTPFTELYATQEAAKGFIQTANAQLNRVVSDLGPMILEKEIADRLVVMKPMVSSLRGSFERKDIPAIVSKKRVLEQRHQELVSLFPSSTSHSTVNELVQLLNQINESLGQAILEKEMETQMQTLNIPFKALTGALQRKDVLSSINWKRQLESQLAPFESKYQSLPQVTGFIQEARELISQVDTILGQEMIEKATEQLAQMSLKATQYDINSPVVVGEAGVTEAGTDEFEGMVDCVNKSNPKPKLKQDLYICLTCFSEPQAAIQGVCAGCRDVCHVGHTIGPKISIAASCSCERYEESNGPCQCTDSKQFPRQEYQPKPWVQELGFPSDDDLKFIIYCFQYIKKISNIFAELDEDSKDRDLKRIGDLQEGIYSIASQIGVNLNGPLKGLIEQEVKTSFAGTNQKLVPEFWNELMDKCKERGLGSIKNYSKDKVEKDQVIHGRMVYLDRYKFIEWGFIQGTPAGRELFNKKQEIHLSNHALIKNPIPWTKTSPTAEEKEKVDQFWKSFCDLTTDNIPQFTKLGDIEKLYNDAVKALSGIYYFNEFKFYVGDYISWLKYIETEKGAKPSHLPHSFENLFGWNDHADLALYACFHREWDKFFYQLGELMRKYSKAPKCKFAEDQVKFDRFAFYCQEFYESSTDTIKSYSFPLIRKWELKGKLGKSQEIIKQLEKHLGQDAAYLALKNEYEATRKNRMTILSQLTEKDIAFNKVLQDASTKFQSKNKEYISKNSPKSYLSFDNRLEIIPNISSQKGKDLIFENFRANDPNPYQVYELSNGNWFLSWGPEVDGAEDYKERLQIALDLAKRIYTQNSINYDISKNGTDKLAQYMAERSQSTKCKEGQWTVAGKINGLHNFTTHHSFVHPDASYALLVPQGAHSVIVDKRVSHFTYDYITVKGTRFEEKVTHYKWHVKYSLDKVAVDVEVKSLTCDLFSSLEGSKSSLYQLHSELRKI